MRIEDKKIKNLIKTYQTTGEKYQEILEMLSEYIYNFPRLVYKANDDFCGEFYLYFFDKIKNVLKKYRIEEHKFISWMISVLRNHYLNWLKKINKRNQEKDLILVGEIQNNIEHKIWLAKENQNYRELSKDLNQEIVYEIRGKLEKALNSLPPKVRIVMKLHYFDFFKGKDLEEAGKIFKQDKMILINKYDRLLDLLPEQYEREQENIENINHSFYKIKEAQKRLNELYQSNQSSKKLEQGEILNKKLIKWQQKREKYIKEYQKFHIKISNTNISDFLGIKLNTLHNLIFRGKAILKQKLE